MKSLFLKILSISFIVVALCMFEPTMAAVTCNATNGCIAGCAWTQAQGYHLCPSALTQYCPGGSGESCPAMPCPSTTAGTANVDPSGSNPDSTVITDCYFNCPTASNCTVECKDANDASSSRAHWSISLARYNFVITAPNGRYLNDTTLPTNCLPCEAGYYCINGTTANTGTTGRNRCINGYYCSGTGNHQRTECGAGYYCPNPAPADGPGNTSRTNCGAGNYCPGSTELSPTTCPAGSRCPGTNRTAHEPCPEGTYQNQTGQTACKNCPKGSYCQGAGRTSPQACPGMTCTTNGNACTAITSWVNDPKKSSCTTVTTSTQAITGCNVPTKIMHYCNTSVTNFATVGASVCPFGCTTAKNTAASGQPKEYKTQNGTGTTVTFGDGATTSMPDIDHCSTQKKIRICDGIGCINMDEAVRPNNLYDGSTKDKNGASITNGKCPGETSSGGGDGSLGDGG